MPRTKEENDELFKSAVESFKSVHSAWLQQLQYALGHPGELVLEYAALKGDYDLLQPFIQQSLSGALAAMSRVGFDPQWREKLSAAQKVIISIPKAGEPTSAKLAKGTLTIRVRLDKPGRPPEEEVAAALRMALGGKAERPPKRAMEPVPAPTKAKPAAKSKPAATKKTKKVSMKDNYQKAADFMTQLEKILRDADRWPGDKPAGKIKVEGAFGTKNMSFMQWLAWVLIPRVQQIIAEKGTFPSSSQVAAFAIRELDGDPACGEIHDVLYEFDAFINNLAARK